MTSRSLLLQELDTILRDITERSAEESKTEARVHYAFQFLVIGNDPTNVNSLLGSAILDLDINQPSPGFDPQGRLPKDKDQFLCLFLDKSNQIAGLVETTQNHLTHVASLDVVMIKPSFQGKGLCKPFVKTTLAHLLSLGFLEISVEVFSQTMGGIPACLCYYRAAKELHLKIRYAEKGKLVPLTSEAVCLVQGKNDISMEFTV